MKKQEIINELNKYHFNTNEYMVISGSSMVLQDIKEETNDIDISVSEKYFKYLKENYDCELIKDNVYAIEDIEFGPNYYNRDEIIYYNNIPIQNIDGIRKLKQNLNREKDLKDLNLIDKHININSLALAYLGDCVYELYIRKYLINKNFVKVNTLQKEAIKYVSAKGQCKFVTKLIEDNILSNEELEVFHRARNYKTTSHPKNTDIITYKYATGFEAIIGYLELKKNNKRIEEIIELCIKE